mmetsp:Transcript_18411/g.42278  ORF Transcript_18411/g.42278 Transcript_18411/m.42278 type:complete len:228 (-) Transcript_18411:844-1527(-)
MQQQQRTGRQRCIRWYRIVRNKVSIDPSILYSTIPVRLDLAKQMEKNSMREPCCGSDQNLGKVLVDEFGFVEKRSLNSLPIKRATLQGLNCLGSIVGGCVFQKHLRGTDFSLLWNKHIQQLSVLTAFLLGVFDEIVVFLFHRQIVFRQHVFQFDHAGCPHVCVHRGCTLPRCCVPCLQLARHVLGQNIFPVAVVVRRPVPFRGSSYPQLGSHERNVVQIECIRRFLR